MNSEPNPTVVLITGASGGIGLATARAFAAQGARMVLHGHKNRATLDSLAEEIQNETVVAIADLTEEIGTESIFRAGIDAFGRIDALVVNAGIWVSRDVPLCDMSLEQWRRTLDVDLTSAFLTCRAFLRHLTDQPRQAASIVLVGSTAALFGEAGHADYAAAKAGLVHGLGTSLKNEIVRLAPRGRVNCVCPGWTRTAMTADAISDRESVARANSTMAMRKLAEPEDVAHAIVFLSSDHLAGHISGAVVPVSGGMEGRLLHP